jgi:hypothetical protein
MKEASANTFFDQLGSILQTNQYWLSEETAKDYSPIGVNIGLSQHLDTILYVNEMNKWWLYMSPKMHYDYLFYSVRKMKRPFKKWAKKVKDEDVNMISEYYQINKKKAEDIASILTKDQLKSIKEEMK